MGAFKNLNVRPLRDGDIGQLLAWRRAYLEGDLELPHGWKLPQGVETAVAEKNGLLLSSMTATQAVILDPLIRNPVAGGMDMVTAIYALERALTYQAQIVGAVDAYIAVPSQLEEYHKIVENAGYQRTVEHCHVFRRALIPDTIPLLGAERDRILADARVKLLAPPPVVSPPETTVE